MREPSTWRPGQVVQAAYSDAQHDLDTILTRPTLFDPDPVTADFRGARLLRTARDGGALGLVDRRQRGRDAGDRLAARPSEADQSGCPVRHADRSRIAEPAAAAPGPERLAGSIQLRQG